MITKPTRRGLIAGLASLIAAPAVIRIADLMPVRAVPLVLDDSFLGNVMFNTYAAAGGWICVGPGTPGTWKAMADFS